MMFNVYNLNAFSKLPDAVLFDTDNTLYHYDPAHSAAMKAVKKKVTDSFSISESQFELAFNNARKEVKQRLDGKASSHSRLLYFQRMLEIMGLGSQVLMALDFEQTYWRTFLSNAKLFNDVKVFLDELRLAGIPTAVVTDLTAQIQFRKIVYFGLDHYFDYIVTSEEAGYDKPHVAPFDMAIEKMKPKGDCIWMIGDSPVNDVKGSRDSISAVTLQKVHEGVQTGKNELLPDCSFTSYSKLIDLLHSISDKKNHIKI